MPRKRTTPYASTPPLLYLFPPLRPSSAMIITLTLLSGHLWPGLIDPMQKKHHPSSFLYRYLGHGRFCTPLLLASPAILHPILGPAVFVVSSFLVGVELLVDPVPLKLPLNGSDLTIVPEPPCIFQNQNE